ncbi:MAG TPA: PLP-dependent aminotransferase family protein [Gemmatimonadales bacterium]
MTMWNPDLAAFAGPAYVRIAAAIATGIEHQELGPGDRLPTHRELSATLGVALTTVTRGYREAERLGLVAGHVGRGTFVRGRVPSRTIEVSGIDLRPNSMPPYPEATALIADIGRILASAGAGVLLDYLPHGGAAHHRETGAEWMRRAGVPATAANVLVTSGVQHAMATVLATVTRPGDTVLVEAVTYGGMKSLANLLGIRLQGLPMDAEGLLPDGLRAACQRGDPAALYCMPSLQNPSAAVMSEPRRDAIADIVREFELTLVEDDSYGFLLRGATPLAARLPEAYYLTGTSKSLAPALRVGFIRAPSRMTGRVEAAISATTYMVSAILADVVVQWTADGTAERVMAWKRGEVTARQAMARDLLGSGGYHAHPNGQHGWLVLPDPWTTVDFVSQAAQRGVHVSPAEDYAVSRDATPHAVRLCVGPTPTRGLLREGLSILVEILADPPPPRASVV